LPDGYGLLEQPDGVGMRLLSLRRLPRSCVARQALAGLWRK